MSYTASKHDKEMIREQRLFPHRKIIVITGGFDPLHSGHLEYIKSAMRTSAFVVVGLNSDDWLIRKKGKYFMPFEERYEIVSSLYATGAVIGFDDTDDTALNAIRKVRELCPENTIIFGNGGDRDLINSPETAIEDDNVEFVFGLGGDNKKNSSSWILEEWKSPRTTRPWGYYRVLHNTQEKTNREVDVDILDRALTSMSMHADIPVSAIEKSYLAKIGGQVKTKELTINPNQAISYQKHAYRNELWFISEGTALVNVSDYSDIDTLNSKRYNQYDTIQIPAGKYHKITNPTVNPLRIVEIQYGIYCEEDDIERVEEENIDFHLQG